MTSSDIYTLTIRFAGICTHFRHGVIAGVPHRVVLPDASCLRSGAVTVRQTPEVIPRQFPYQLLPHFAQLEVEGGDPAALDVPALVNDGGPMMKEGDILGPIRLQVRNALDEKLDDLDDATPKLTKYVPSYTPSEDVVGSGRAACFFDLYGGKVTSFQAPGGAAQILVEVKTDGPPELLVTPLVRSNAPPHSHRLPLFARADTRQSMLFVKNLELVRVKSDAAGGPGGDFDFLLHYLTDRGGIPPVINAPTPGMRTDQIRSASPAELLAAWSQQGRRRQLIHPDEVTPSCSNSQYP